MNIPSSHQLAGCTMLLTAARVLPTLYLDCSKFTHPMNSKARCLARRSPLSCESIRSRPGQTIAFCFALSGLHACLSALLCTSLPRVDLRMQVGILTGIIPTHAERFEGKPFPTARETSESLTRPAESARPRLRVWGGKYWPLRGYMKSTLYSMI